MDARGGRSEDRVASSGLTRAIGRVALASSRRAGLALTLILIITAVLGYGTTKLTTNVDVADVLPRGDGNTTAAHKLTANFKSAFTEQVTLQFHVDETGQNWARDNTNKVPLRRTAPNAQNITDEVYIRAMAQAIQFMRDQDPYVCCTIALSDLFRLINWTVAGGQSASDASYNLTDTSATGEVAYASVHNSANAAILSALDALSSPTWTTTAVLLMPPAQLDVPMAEIGQRAIAARDAYVAWAGANPDKAYQVFTGDNFPRLTVELPVANAHSSALTREDFARLLPLIAGFILLCLFVAFRNLGAVLVTFSALAMGTLWTYGIEGYMGIALNPLNLTLMPLIMGIGIDYSIHIANEFQEHKSRGLTHALAFQEVGRRAGTALFIATLTTVVGLLVMAFSPSVLIVEYGILAALSITIMYVLCLVYIPAVLTLLPGSERMGANFRPSKVMPFVARFISRGRVLVIPAVILLMVLGTVGSAALYNEAFGDPGRNYLQDDPVRQEHEKGLRWFYESPTPDIKANVIVFDGDLTDPQAHRYMRAIEAELKKQPLVISDTLRTIPFLIETWLTVKGGGPGAVQTLAQQRSGQAPYPQTAAAIRSELDQLYASPMAELGSIFTNGPLGQPSGYNLGVMTFSVRAATYAEAKEVWDQVWSAIGAAGHQKPAELKVAFVGNTATNYLFVAKEVPWVGYMGVASSLFLFLFLIPFFRSWKPLAAIMLVNFATIAIWIGILPQLDIGLAITLVLPLIFISAVGTDYAVHLAWSIRQVGDAWAVFRTTGKAVFYSWITTTGPFLIFIGIQDLSVRKTMIATGLAVTIVFLITILVMASFFRVEPGGALAEHARGIPGAPPEPLRAVKYRKGPTPGLEAPGPLVAIRRPKRVADEATTRVT